MPSKKSPATTATAAPERKPKVTAERKKTIGQFRDELRELQASAKHDDPRQSVERLAKMLADATYDAIQHL